MAEHAIVAGDDAVAAGDERSSRSPTAPGRCLAAGITVALAESCTGGLVAAAITAVPGSSGYFLGGVVSYADEAKRDLLGVDAGGPRRAWRGRAPRSRGRWPRARERASGRRVAASVTGIAGPDGGSAEKPVGLTYVGVADAAGVDVRRIVWSGDRAANRQDERGRGPRAAPRADRAARPARRPTRGRRRDARARSAMIGG